MARVKQDYKEHAKSINSTGVFTSAEIAYIVFDAADEEEALYAVLNEAPKTCNSLPLDGIEMDSRENETTFKVNAVYKDSSTSSDETTEPTLSFDCGGGTKHMTHSISQTIAFGTKKAGGAIGWNGKSGSEMEIAGVDVPTAQFRETYIRVMSLSSLTTRFKRNVGALVGKVNSNSFKGWEPGEVMFLGMSYSTPSGSARKVAVTFNFAIQPNESGATVAGHNVGSKKGFEYGWALSKTSAENGSPKAEVEAIYIDQVCEYVSFSALGL